ncbi:MAG: hypothetical protein ABL951_06275 [Alphaproteobacteria bacterium]
MHVIFRVALSGALLFLLAACASDSQIGLQPLVCPTVGVLADASSLHVFGEGAGGGNNGRAYDLEFMRAHLLECELKDGEMKAAIRFEARARTGPAAVSDEYDYPYFVALLAPDGEVLSKTVRNATAKFKSGKSEIFFAEEYDDIEFSVPEGADGLGYEILIGFQLTREQMDFNRAQRPAPKAVPDVVIQ